MSANESAETFRASLRRCLATEDFLREFYHRLMSSSEEIRMKFEHTDFKRQYQVLENSLYLLAVVTESAAPPTEYSPAWAEMNRLGQLHDRNHLDIRPGLYTLWLHYLIESARSHDPLFTPEVEECWRKTLERGIEYLRSRHEPA